MQIRPASPDERATVANVVDGGALAVEDDRLRRALAHESVLVAVENGGDSDPPSPALGALVLDGEEIVAVAVRPRRRGQGIGTELVEAAADRRDRLLAAFEPDVRPFWSSLGFEIEPESASTDEDARLRGVRRA